MRPITTLFAYAAMAAAMLCSVPAQAGEARAQGSEMAVSQHPTVRVVGGRVEITINGDTPEHINIYSLTGRLVKSLDAQPGTQSVDLPAGYYIVKCERNSQRIIIK